MFDYRCNKCNLLFSNSLIQERCPTFKCQSRQITDITPTPSMGQEVLLMGLEDAGQEYEIERDLAGLSIRQQLFKLYKEIEDDAKHNTGTS